MGNFSLGALPEAFAQAAWSRIETELIAPDAVKAGMRLSALCAHNKSETNREFVRRMQPIIWRQEWDWPNGRVQLQQGLADDDFVDEEMLLEALYQWFTTATMALYRRGQLRSVFGTNRGHLILVAADSSGECFVPCGAKSDQLLLPTPENLKRMPPCISPFCCCRWFAVLPDDIKA